jgi:hypothetical protein
MHRFRALFVLLPLAFAAACSDANSLNAPTQTNIVDTLTIGALEGTPIKTPSGFGLSLSAASAVR